MSLAPFFFILSRQAVTGFDILANGQAYAAWVTLRTGVESALIIGKWLDDKRYAEIWERRFEDRKSYQREYQGKALQSTSLPRSAEIQQALSHINDRFLHPNPEYYLRHLSLEQQPEGDIKLELDFFDDQEGIDLGILGILHLTAVIQDSLAAMFADRFVNTPRLDVGLASLEESGADFRKAVAERGPDEDWFLTNIGLWPASPFAARV